METHKPKSWHSPGEFVREILIIVVGVLIALSGEQAVEWIHHQNELAETREALREEIAQNANLITVGAAFDSCRVVIVEKLADWARGGPKPKKSSSIGFVRILPILTLSKTLHIVSRPPSSTDRLAARRATT